MNANQDFLDAEPSRALAAGLYIVSTPIGNLEDITIRAVKTLAACDRIACENTRKSAILLNRYGIKTKRELYSEHNSDRKTPILIGRIQAGEAIALISDAGTPVISDPGRRLVRAALDADLPVIPVPGASAVLAALVAGGLEADRFRFIGFAPSKAKARTDLLRTLADAPDNLVFFENKTRLPALLKAAAQIFGVDRPACIARELTKMHESFYRAPLGELRDFFAAQGRIKGELVVLIEGKCSGEGEKIIDDSSDDSSADLVLEKKLRQALKVMKIGEAAAHISAQTGLSRQDLYRRALELKKREDRK